MPAHTGVRVGVILQEPIGGPSGDLLTELIHTQDALSADPGRVVHRPIPREKVVTIQYSKVFQSESKS